MDTIKDGYLSRKYNVATKRYCRSLNLRNNPELIKEYRKRHSKEYVWREILEGIRSVGILEMEIYIVGCRLFMIVETPVDFNWDEAMERLGKLPRQQEWEDYMSCFQDSESGKKATEKWQLMERMFHLYDDI